MTSTRCHSKLLAQNFTIFDNGAAVFADGTTYSGRELDLIRAETEPAVIRAIHNVKRICDGTVLSYGAPVLMPPHKECPL
jgi:hypothetical protein